MIAAILGTWEGIDHVREVAKKHGEEKTQSTPLLSATNTVRIQRGDPVGDRRIIADVIEVTGGRHQVPDNSVWFANTILLKEGATIAGSHVALLARSIDGGRIDVSGSAAHADGGNIFIAASRVSNVQFIARGADGAPGAQGAHGGDGRDGDCAGFGGYKGANPGLPGGAGGTGGAGGDGGHIQIAVEKISPTPAPQDYEGGRGGAGGPGGVGGKGGTGCTGLGGTQPSQPGGNSGSSGTQGSLGNPGSLDIRTVPYEKLLRLVGKSNDPQQAIDAVAQNVFVP